MTASLNFSGDRGVGRAAMMASMAVGVLALVGLVLGFFSSPQSATMRKEETMKNKTIPMIIGILTLSLATLSLTACSSTKGGKSGDKSGGTAGGKKSKARPVPVIEHDLAAAHKFWKGFTIRAPKNAEVKTEGGTIVRILGPGNGKGVMEMESGDDLGFDISISRGWDSFKRIKKRLEKHAKDTDVKLKSTHKILKEEPNLLTWWEATGDFRVYHVVIHLKVGGKDITCRSYILKGAGNEAEKGRFLAACRSIKKK